jgi:hypothetical protein
MYNARQTGGQCTTHVKEDVCRQHNINTPMLDEHTTHVADKIRFLKLGCFAKRIPDKSEALRVLRNLGSSGKDGGFSQNLD